MEVKSREDILRELIKAAEEFPEGWRAGFRRDKSLHADEYYIYNPEVGLYEIKEYHVNPFEKRGIGTKIPERSEKFISRILDERFGDFAVIQLDINQILERLEESRGKEPITIKFGRDIGIDIPIEGPAHIAPYSLKKIDAGLANDQRIIDREFRKLLDRDGITRAYA